MLKMARKQLAFIYGGIVAIGLAGGIALGSECDGNYCQADVGNCFPMGEYTQGTCCVGGYCMQCTREQYWCYYDNSTIPGPAFDCHNPGASCN